jgi:hypothetical protein
MAIGNIIMVVAVLEIHMDKKKLATINPARMLAGLTPVILKIFKAILRCRFHFSIASATRNPPKNKNMTSLK